MRAIDKRISRLQAAGMLDRHGYPKHSSMSASKVCNMRWEDHYADYLAIKRVLLLQLQLPDKKHPNIHRLKHLMRKSLYEMKFEQSRRGRVLP